LIESYTELCLLTNVNGLGFEPEISLVSSKSLVEVVVGISVDGLHFSMSFVWRLSHRNLAGVMGDS
jgi:hypothetical protein